MKVLFSGARNWLAQKPIEALLRTLPPGTIVIHGAARGVDNIAGEVAKSLGFEVRAYPALADGRKWPWAGPARNQVMLDREHPDKEGVYIDKAFFVHHDPGLGKGTRDMRDRVLKATPAIEVIVHLGRRS